MSAPGGVEPTTTHSAIEDLAPYAGNANLLSSRMPAPDPILKRRVGQYLNARGAGLLDTTPDGKQVLMATRFASTVQLHLLEMPMGARHQLTFLEEPVSSACFHPANSSILYYLQDAGGGEFYQVWTLDRASGRSSLLTDGKSRHSLPRFSRDGSLALFSSNSRNGKDTDVYLAQTADPLTSLTLASRITETTGTWGGLEISPDGKAALVMQYRSIDDADLWEINLVTREKRQLSPREGRAGISGAAYSPDGKSVYVITDRYSDFNELIELRIQGAEAGTTRSLSSTIPWNVEGLEVSPDGTAVAFLVNEDGISRLYLLDPVTGKIRPVDLPPGIAGNIHFPLKNPGTLFLSVDSARSPSDIYQLTISDGKLTRWTRSEVGGLNTSGFVEAELVRYPSTMGVQVPAFIYTPPTAVVKAAGGKVPVLILFHGGPEGQSRPNFSPFIQMLVTDLGIAVVMPNVRGSDGYGKKFLALDNGIKREESLADIGATLDWIATRKELDSSRVAAYGGSYGGYMVLAALCFYPERFVAGVDVVGVSSIPTFLQNTQDYRRDLRRAEYGDERIPEVREVQERISPLNHVSRIRAALFVQQGKNDPRVPQSEAEQIVQAVRKNGWDCWYLLGLNEGHGFAKKENRDTALVATVQFLRDKLNPVGQR